MNRLRRGRRRAHSITITLPMMLICSTSAGTSVSGLVTLAPPASSGANSVTVAPWTTWVMS